MSLQEDAQAAVDAANKVLDDVSGDGTPTPGDTVLSSVVSALENVGYTVTAPATQIPVQDGEEAPLE